MKSNPHLTVLTIVFGLLAIYLFIDIKFILYFAITVSLISILSFNFSKIIEKVWFGLAQILSQIIPNLLLSIIFYILLTPLAILSKLFKAKTDFISRNNQKTIFKTETREFKKESFNKTW